MRTTMMLVCQLPLMLAVMSGCNVEDAAPTPSQTVEVAGAKSEALSHCYAAWSKVTARQGCWGYWVQNEDEAFIENGLCPNTNHYFIWTPDNQPTNGDVLFEVDVKVCRPGQCGWRLKEYVRCNCFNDPCWTVDENGN